MIMCALSATRGLAEKMHLKEQPEAHNSHAPEVDECKFSLEYWNGFCADGR